MNVWVVGMIAGSHEDGNYYEAILGVFASEEGAKLEVENREMVVREEKHPPKNVDHRTHDGIPWWKDSPEFFIDKFEVKP